MKKCDADGRAGMNVDTGARMRPFRHHARDERRAGLMEPVREPLNGNCLDKRIRQNDLLAPERGRIAFESSFNVRVQQLADFRQ